MIKEVEMQTTQKNSFSCLLLAKSRKLAVISTVIGYVNFLQNNLEGQGRAWWEETEGHKGNKVGQELINVEAVS